MSALNVDSELLSAIHNRFNHCGSPFLVKPVKAMYSIWIRIEGTLPWIELKGEYATRREARQAAQKAISNVTVKLVSIPREKSAIRALATVRTKH
jgi:hypothetical protein